MATITYVDALRTMVEREPTYVKNEVYKLYSWKSNIKDPHYKPPEYHSFVFCEAFYNVCTKHFPEGHELFEQVLQLYNKVREAQFTDIYS